MAVKFTSKKARDEYVASLKAAPAVVPAGRRRETCPTCGQPKN